MQAFQFDIVAVDHTKAPVFQSIIDGKTKPLGSLGLIEALALKVALIQQSAHPRLSKPTIVVFAADHGIAAEGVSAYGQEVTSQMVRNFTNGGAAINVFCRQHDIDLKIVDVGVADRLEASLPIIHAKIRHGTRNFLHEPAMRLQELEQAFFIAQRLVYQSWAEGCNVIGFGEMGIANTTSASAMMSLLTHIPVENCTGRGTGISSEQYAHKLQIIRKVVATYQHMRHSPLDVLQACGGYEIAAMCAAMLAAAEKRMLILVDGFIASVAFLLAYLLCARVRDYAVFSHLSDEQGHAFLLKYLGVEPLLRLGMRLGEGTGCALAYPLVVSAVSFFNEMASFEEAGISK